jgi:HPt (histidine-containing phosphotransfer) domain-containing protein
MDFEFDELKREFLAEARAKVDEISGALRQQDSAAFERMTYLAHQLKGAGGSYGFQKISTEAAALETTLERMAADASDAGGKSSDAVGKLELHVRALSDEIEMRSSELTVT